MNKFHLRIVAICILGGSQIAFSVVSAHATQCSVERPSSTRSHWSYRIIDGRKCWYEGKPMLSKSMLYWPLARAARRDERDREANVVPENYYNLLDAQASISGDPEAILKPQVKPEMIDDGVVPTPKRTLTHDDLRAWANSMAAVTAEPILTILDRWPDKELAQQRSKPTPIEVRSQLNARTIMMATITFMALLAVLSWVTFHSRPLSKR
jgi:hypothetical protein